MHPEMYPAAPWPVDDAACVRCVATRPPIISLEELLASLAKATPPPSYYVDTPRPSPRTNRTSRVSRPGAHPRPELAVAVWDVDNAAHDFVGVRPPPSCRVRFVRGGGGDPRPVCTAV